MGTPTARVEVDKMRNRALIACIWHEAERNGGRVDFPGGLDELLTRLRNGWAVERLATYQSSSMSNRLLELEAAGLISRTQGARGYVTGYELTGERPDWCHEPPRKTAEHVEAPAPELPAKELTVSDHLMAAADCLMRALQVEVARSESDGRDAKIKVLQDELTVVRAESESLRKERDDLRRQLVQVQANLDTLRERVAAQPPTQLEQKVRQLNDVKRELTTKGGK